MKAKVLNGWQVKKTAEVQAQLYKQFFIFQAVLSIGFSCSFGHTEHRTLLVHSLIQWSLICIACIY